MTEAAESETAAEAMKSIAPSMPSVSAASAAQPSSEQASEAVMNKVVQAEDAAEHGQDTSEAVRDVRSSTHDIYHNKSNS
jgi:hypothetical protein